MSKDSRFCLNLPFLPNTFIIFQCMARLPLETIINMDSAAVWTNWRVYVRAKLRQLCLLSFKYFFPSHTRGYSGV